MRRRSEGADDLEVQATEVGEYRRVVTEVEVDGGEPARYGAGAGAG